MYYKLYYKYDMNLIEWYETKKLNWGRNGQAECRGKEKQLFV